MRNLGFILAINLYVAFMIPMANASTLSTKVPALADQLTRIRTQVERMEHDLVYDLKAQKHAQTQVKRIQALLQLRKQQKVLGEQRLQELEHTVAGLATRKSDLRIRVAAQQISIRKFLGAIEGSDRESSGGEVKTFHLPEQEKLEAPRRKVLGNLVDHGLKEIEALRADLADVNLLENHIQEEQHEIAYLFQDLKEQESVLELSRELQLEVLSKNKKQHLVQLENYRKLKGAEAQVEQMIGDFNARLELEHAAQTEKLASRAMQQGSFSKLKGKLPFPVGGGRVVSLFGRSFDSKSGLHVFKKGVDIAASKNQPVRSISAGKIVYSGDLPNYGRVVIVDHGDHFYSLFGHLGAIIKKTSESVASGDLIGQTDSSGTPLYFEIRSRNVAVNPLQWVLN